MTLTVVAAGRSTGFLPDRVQADHRQVGQVPHNQGVFVRSGQAGHDCDGTPELFMGDVVGIAILTLEESNPAFIVCEWEGGGQASDFFELRSCEIDVVKDALLIIAYPPQRIRPGMQAQMVRTATPGCLDSKPFRIVPFDQPEWKLMAGYDAAQTLPPEPPATNKIR